MFEGNNVRMEEFFHYLKFSVLVAFILVNLLNCNDFSSFCDSCLRGFSINSDVYLKNDAKRAISNNSVCIISKACLNTMKHHSWILLVFVSFAFPPLSTHIMLKAHISVTLRSIYEIFKFLYISYIRRDRFVFLLMKMYM